MDPAATTEEEETTDIADNAGEDEQSSGEEDQSSSSLADYTLHVEGTVHILGFQRDPSRSAMAAATSAPGNPVSTNERAEMTDPSAASSATESESAGDGLMPAEQLYSDDSDTAGSYQVSANTSASSNPQPSQPSYQRGLLSSSSDDSLDDNMDDSTTNSDSSSELSDDAREDISSLNIDMKKVRVPGNLLSYTQSRMLGNFGRHHSYTNYTQRMRSNINFVRRLRVDQGLEGHNGCINALNFNQSGTWLASGSDDTKVYIWDVCTQRPYMNFYSGHDSNVFQTKFMPHSNDSQVVTCSRDGKVRLAELSTSGSCRSTKKIAQHSAAVHKLAVENDSPHCLLSVAEDGVIYQIDLRERRPTKLATISERGRRVPLYSIDKRPCNQYEFAVGGKDKDVRVYDKRKIDFDDGEEGMLKKFHPHIFDGARTVMKDVTAAVYSFDGSEILATYNDDDIYLFESDSSDGADSIATYSGHRNSATVKGVNFFGPRSEYIVSGSDCGNVYFWDKKSCQLVHIEKGDEGVVNVLEPHPIYPYLAVSGLDHDVKLLMPMGKPSDVSRSKKVLKRNRKHRRMDSFFVSEALNRQIYLSAMGFHRRRATVDTDSDSDDDDGPRNMQCRTS